MRLTAKRSPKPIAFPPKRTRLLYYAAEAADEDGALETYTVSVLRDGIDLSTSFFQTRAKAKRSPFVWFPSTARKRPSRFR